MKNFIKKWHWCGVLLLLGSPLWAATAVDEPTAASTDAAKRQAVIAFVNHAVTYVNDKGKYEAIMAFNNPSGPFRQGDQYIFAFVCGAGAFDGFNLADSPKVQAYTVFVDAGNYAPIDAMLQTASPIGSWFDYRFNDPIDNKTHAKHSYVVRLPNHALCIGSGYYDSDTTAAENK